MKIHSVLWIVPAIGILMSIGCTSSHSDSNDSPSNTSPAAGTEVTILPNGEPSMVTVQHCLIGFEGSVAGKTVRRKQSDAEQLAKDLLKLLEAGDDFDEIIHQYTDDSPPGIYTMTNSGVPIPPGSDAMSRDGMVKAFGDIGFKLQVGEFGLAPYDPATSKFGWHIIKRIK